MTNKNQIAHFYKKKCNTCINKSIIVLPDTEMDEMTGKGMSVGLPVGKLTMECLGRDHREKGEALK